MSKAPVSIHGLLSGLLPRDVRFQPLDAAMVGYKKTRQANQVTFETQEDLDHGRLEGPWMQKQAMILWLDRDYVQKQINQDVPGGVPVLAYDPLRQIQAALHQLRSEGQLSAASPTAGVDLLTLEETLNEKLGPVA